MWVYDMSVCLTPIFSDLYYSIQVTVKEGEGDSRDRQTVDCPLVALFRYGSLKPPLLLLSVYRHVARNASHACRFSPGPELRYKDGCL